MSAPKAIAQMIIIGGRILGRAFKDAYKQANANSAAARAAAGNANAESN
ncbi:Mitochondrial import inner membrane translocase subunit tim16, partial [Smittium culicis]